MMLDPGAIPTRDKQILAGLFLSRYDKAGLRKLGFESFAEAFNVIGYALKSKPASIKNYRDEFDPLFANKRKGWHKRPTREYCLKVYAAYESLDFDAFASLVKALTGYNESIWSPVDAKDSGEDHSFARRLITGLAAEQYFEEVRLSIPEFSRHACENTTRLGCGYDFKLQVDSQKEFLAIEVKGLKERSGSIALTPKEHEVASKLRERFFLFVVKNFREEPYHQFFRNPVSELPFSKKERVVVQVSWQTSV